MRYAFVGDIHGNLEALQAVLADLQTQKADEILCLGDVVGYGADPSECLRVIREVASHTVAGNHDHAASGKLPMWQFNEYAWAAIIWTTDHLTEDEKNWLAQLPLVVHRESFSIVHSSLDNPDEFNYIESVHDALACFEAMKEPLCFIGHSHMPVVFFEGDRRTGPRYELDLEKPVSVQGRMIINPGSVGQPRDDDPRAAYCIYDTDAESITFRRITYDVSVAANKVRAAGLPELLAFRLEIGR